MIEIRIFDGSDRIDFQFASFKEYLIERDKEETEIYNFDSELSAELYVDSVQITEDDCFRKKIQTLCDINVYARGHNERKIYRDEETPELVIRKYIFEHFSEESKKKMLNSLEDGINEFFSGGGGYYITLPGTVCGYNFYGSKCEIEYIDENGDKHETIFKKSKLKSIIKKMVKENQFFKQEGERSMEQIVSLEENSKSIQTELNNTKLSFVRIGYYLKQARDSFDWENTEYADVWDYAKECFGFSKSTASRFMSINDEFSIDGNSTELLPEYTEYSSSVLTEMLGLTQEERKEIKPSATVKDVRQKKAELHPDTVRKKQDIKTDEVQQQKEVKKIQVDRSDILLFRKILAEVLANYYSDVIYDENGNLLAYEREEDYTLCPLCKALHDLKITEIKYKEYIIKKDGYTYFDVSIETELGVKEKDIFFREIAEYLHQEELRKQEESEETVEQAETIEPVATSQHDSSVYNGKISNCPFCGGKMESAVMCFEKEDINIKVRCFHCGAAGGSGWSYEEAIKLWNSRDNMQSEKEQNIDVPPEEKKEFVPHIVDNSALCPSCYEVLEFGSDCKQCGTFINWDGLEELFEEKVNGKESYINSLIDTLSENDIFFSDYITITEKKELDDVIYSIIRKSFLANNDCNLVELIDDAKRDLYNYINDMSEKYFMHQQNIDKESSKVSINMIEQPELPKLTNNKQRTEFIDNYRSWPLWIEVEETGERYYRYVLDNDISIVVRTRKMHKIILDEREDELVYRAEDYYLLGVKTRFNVKKDEFMKDKTRTFAECCTTKAVLVDFLKDYQKGAIE